jgi:hypothetical protein
MEWKGNPIRDRGSWLMADPLILHSTAVAGRGGRAGIQGDVLAVPKGRRGSEQRVYWARS